MPHLEISKTVLAHCNIVNNDYQHNLKVLYKFNPCKLFGQLLDILPKSFVFLKIFNSDFLQTFNSEFSQIKIWFTDQNSKVLEIEDTIDIILVIN